MKARYTYKSASPDWQVPDNLSLFAEKYTDVVILARGREFPAHVVLLACASGYFEAALSSGLLQEGRLTLDADPDYVQAVIDFIYKGKCTVDDPNELFELAHFLQFEGLIVAVETLHGAEGGLAFLPLDALFRLLKNCIRFNSKELPVRENVIRELGRQMSTILTEHLELVATLDVDTFVAWLAHDDVACPEAWVLQLVSAWLRNNPGVEAEVEKRVLSVVRFENIGKRKRHDVRTNEYVSKHPTILLEALWGKVDGELSRPRGGIAFDDKNSYQPGTRVEVIGDLEYVKERCKRGVGWCEPMKEMLGRTHVIKKVIETKDRIPRVEFSHYKMPVSCLQPAE